MVHCVWRIRLAISLGFLWYLIRRKYRSKWAEHVVSRYKEDEFEDIGVTNFGCVTLVMLKNMNIYFITSRVPNSKFKLHRMRKLCGTYELLYMHCYFRATTAIYSNRLKKKL